MKKRALILVCCFLVLFVLSIGLAEAAETLGIPVDDFQTEFGWLYKEYAAEYNNGDWMYKDDILNQQGIIELNEDVELRLPYVKSDGIAYATEVRALYDESDNEDSESMFIISMQCALLEIAFLKEIELPEDFNQFLTDIISTGKQEFGDCFVYFSRSGSEGSYHYEMLVTKDDSAMALSKDTDSSSTEAAYDQNAAKQFSDVLSELEAQKLIPKDGRQSYYNEDYEDSWAQINWYQWYPFTKAKNFVITAEISWESASERPNTFTAGCGFVFRDNGNKNARSMLTASINMDGRVYLSGKRSGYDLNYHNYYYGPSQIKATHQFTLLANGENVRMYVDGQQVANYAGVAVVDEGNIGFATMSGTNTGFGTRCEFKNIFYDVW